MQLWRKPELMPKFQMHIAEAESSEHELLKFSLRWF
jgi:hypothetical protein